MIDGQQPLPGAEMTDEREAELRAMYLELACDRVLTVREARALRCCRICRKSPPRVPTILNYGAEYACEVCVADKQAWRRLAIEMGRFIEHVLPVIKDYEGSHTIASALLMKLREEEKKS